uniref:Uncharacterized protein n=1 Tax=Acrobeloides nanus TaxID=290746 RepID=A0A914CNF5_9BILA
MLRQLLSAPIDDLCNMSLPKPVPAALVESPIKNDAQEFAVLSNMAPNLPPMHHQYPIYYATNTNYEYAHVAGPIQYSIEDAYLPQAYSYIGSTHGSTSELFSSTYAVLSSDSDVSNEWTQHSAQAIEKVPPAQAYLDPYVQYNGSHIVYATSTNNNTNNIPDQNKYINYYPEKEETYLSQQDDSKAQHSSNINGSISRCTSSEPTKIKSKTSRAQAIEAFRRVAQIPIGKPVSPANGNGDVVTNGDDDDTSERVMCLACKGVYPSRREIIGRNYLDQMVQATQGDIPDPTVSDGISPVCPYCDRFISHYKGNIRRHINQCVKARGKRNSVDSNAPVNEPDIDSPLCNEPTSSTYFDYSLGNDKNNSTMYYSNNTYDTSINIIQNGIVGSTTEQLECNQVSKAKKAASKTPKEIRPLSTSASTTADDPYICSWCNFKTVYKGNMKRHLISCHSTTDESLRQNKFDIEKLRATSNDRPVYLPTSYIDEEISVMNGKTPRGRRPKNSKNGTKEEVDGENFASDES